nr:unnamed protein product [Digitaria exilis]
MADAGSCVEPLYECLESTGMIDAAAREVASFVRVKWNWGDLAKARDSLHAVEATVRAGVAAEEDKLNVCDPQVQLWLKRVEEVQLDTIDEDYGKLAKFSCLGQCTVHASRRASIGKRVVEALDEVNKLIEEGKGFRKFGFKPAPEIVDLLPQVETFGLESMLNQLHDLLENDDSNIIGVWGQGGIGKTTLLHAFNNDLEKKARNYQVVIFIEVSNSETLNAVEIQQTISERLNLPWNESETVEKRARFLVKALARKRFVVLLDDVRKKFRLEDVGIPTPATNGKSKLILTSRYQDVCFQMGAHRSLIKMHVLDSGAAWKLFLNKLSPEACAAVNSNSVVREHAEAIFLSCEGLPLALNVIGTAVAGLEGPRYLNLSHTLITRLPERLWLLKELRHLDLSVTVALEDTLNNCSKLLKLRVLNLFRSHYGIRDVDDLNLDSLKALTFLGITIYAEDVLTKLNKTSPLAKSTYRLNLKYCGEMQSIKISDLNHLVHLEELYVESCYDLNTLVADTELTTSRLELLTLSVLPSLENVIVAPMPHHFQHIRKLLISNCPKLQNITWVLKLEMLERLVVTHCDGMLKIVEEDKSDEADTMPDHPSGEQEYNALAEHPGDGWGADSKSVCRSNLNDGKRRTDFPNLRSIVLTDVKKLRSICKPRDFPSLETIRVEDCPNLRSIPLSSTYNCGKLKQVCGSVEWWEKLEWEDKEGMETKFFIPI